MLEQPHLDFTHELAEARGVGTGRQMVVNSLIEYFLGIVSCCLESPINDAIESSTSTGAQADTGAIPNEMEIGGQHFGFRLAEEQDTVRGQEHAAHLGDIVNGGR